jgi:hypothetical protein
LFTQNAKSTSKKRDSPIQRKDSTVPKSIPANFNKSNGKATKVQNNQRRIWPAGIDEDLTADVEPKRNKPLPWWPDYGDDWFSEPLLSASFGAHVLWHRLLILMSRNEKAGWLTQDGKPLSDAQLAKKTHMHLTRFRCLKRELVTLGIAQIDPVWGLYSERFQARYRSRKLCNIRVEKYRARVAAKEVTPKNERVVTRDVTRRVFRVKESHGSSTTSQNPSTLQADASQTSSLRPSQASQTQPAPDSSTSFAPCLDVFRSEDLATNIHVAAENTNSNSGRRRDREFDAFAEAFNKRFGIAYRHQVQDFVQLHRLRKAVTLEETYWQRAVQNYLASPLGKYSVADLASRVEVFATSRLNGYNKPVDSLAMTNLAAIAEFIAEGKGNGRSGS